MGRCRRTPPGGRGGNGYIAIALLDKPAVARGTRHPALTWLKTCVIKITYWWPDCTAAGSCQGWRLLMLFPRQRRRCDGLVTLVLDATPGRLAIPPQWGWGGAQIGVARTTHGAPRARNVVRAVRAGAPRHPQKWGAGEAGKRLELSGQAPTYARRQNVSNGSYIPQLCDRTCATGGR